MIIKKGKPPLSKEKLISYVKRYQQGEKDVFHEIIEHNYGFLIDMVKESCPIGVKGSGHADWDDLLSEAVIGMETAARHFDPTLGYVFNTYARWWVKQAITEYMGQARGSVKIPRHYIEDLRLFSRVKELKESKGLSYEEEKDEIKKKRPYWSDPRIETFLDETSDDPIGEESLSQGKRNVILGESKGDAPWIRWREMKYTSPKITEGEEAEDSLDRKEREKIIENMIEGSSLSNRDKTIIKMYYGFSKKGGESCTLQEIGDIIGLTRERVRQIKNESLDLLRNIVKGSEEEFKILMVG
tara:strand:+ start:537 stop:1433 length:897 start_codon:yes stop_codon:yes gene_type:complete